MYRSDISPPSSPKRPFKLVSKCLSTYSNCSDLDILDKSSVLVPNPSAVLGVNCIKPVAPDPVSGVPSGPKFFCAGSNVPPVSKSIIARISFCGILYFSDKSAIPDMNFSSPATSGGRS